MIEMEYFNDKSNPKCLECKPEDRTRITVTFTFFKCHENTDTQIIVCTKCGAIEMGEERYTEQFINFYESLT